MNESDASSESGAEDVISVHSSDHDTNFLPKGGTPIFMFSWLIQTIMPVMYFYVMLYIRILQVFFEPHYYLIQEQCLCCQSQSPMKFVMISVVQNSAVDVFTSSTEMVVTDAEVRNRHKVIL